MQSILYALHFLTQSAKQSPQERRFRLTLRNAEPLRGSICSEQRETSLLRICLTDVFRNITANAAGPVKGSTAQNWAARRVTVCDCQGLLDVFVGVDVNAHYCYAAWCTEKGEISGIGRPYVLGEAVFIQGSSERMTHVGYVCGFLNGEPLIVEARGLNFGVCVTKFSDRPWTHRGLVSKQLIYTENCYDEQIILTVRRPMIQGDAIKHLQTALNALGYYCGSVDGKCGKLTMSGVNEFVEMHSLYAGNPCSDPGAA